MYCPLCHEHDKIAKPEKKHMCKRCKILFGENTDSRFELRERVKENLERVKDLVPIKEWVGDRFNGYNLVTIGKHKDIEVIADCLQAIVDFMDTFTESEGK